MPPSVCDSCCCREQLPQVTFWKAALGVLGLCMRGAQDGVQGAAEQARALVPRAESPGGQVH